MDVCPGSARPKWTLILRVNSLSKQQHLGRKKKRQLPVLLNITIFASGVQVALAKITAKIYDFPELQEVLSGLK